MRSTWSHVSSSGSKRWPRNPDTPVTTIVAGATAVGPAAKVVEIGDRREAIDHAVAWAQPGDVVLIAGKGHEAGQTSHGQTRPFDDRVELAGALEAQGHRP